MSGAGGRRRVPLPRFVTDPDPQAVPAEAFRGRVGGEAPRRAGSAGVQAAVGPLRGRCCLSLSRRAPRLPSARGSAAAGARGRRCPRSRGRGASRFSRSCLSLSLLLIDEASRVASERAPGGPALPCSLQRGSHGGVRCSGRAEDRRRHGCCRTRSACSGGFLRAALKAREHRVSVLS